MTDSIKKLTKIANKRPETRKHIVPILKQANFDIHFNNTKMIWVLDAFVRFLTGDADIALRQLKKYGNPDVIGLTDLSPPVYNAIVKSLYAKFFATVKQTLK